MECFKIGVGFVGLIDSGGKDVLVVVEEVVVVVRKGKSCFRTDLI